MATAVYGSGKWTASLSICGHAATAIIEPHNTWGFQAEVTLNGHTQQIAVSTVESVGNNWRLEFRGYFPSFDIPNCPGEGDWFRLHVTIPKCEDPPE